MTHGTRASIDSTRTPTPSRRSVHLASSVFAAPPQTRAQASSSSKQLYRGAHTLHGACETKQTAFEWPVRQVRDLKAQLEAEDERGNDDTPDEEVRHEALAGDGAYFDDLAYKIHLGG